MTNGIFQEVYERRGFEPDLFFDFLDTLSLRFFRQLIKPNGAANAKDIALYIVCGYSQDSDMVLNGAEWSANKKEIAETINLPVDLYEATLYLEDLDVLQVVNRYLDLQGRNFMHLQVKKDVYDRLLRTLMKTAKSDTGNVDFNTKELVENSRYMDKLKEDIELMEQDFDQKSEMISNSKKEVSAAIKKQEKQKNINVESNKYIVG